MSDTAETVGTIIGEAASAAAMAFVPAGVLQDVITLAAKYGVPAAIKVFTLWKNAATGVPVTPAEVEAAFADLKAYEAYGIPDVVPVTVASAGVSVPA